MTPTDEEKQRIQEAQLANPDLPLGTAEQFLFSLASISALTPRLQLWAFKLNYEALEKVSLSHTQSHSWISARSRCNCGAPCRRLRSHSLT